MSSSFIITDPDELHNALKEQRVVKEIQKTLTEYYPKRCWLVQVNVEGGIAYISNPQISASHGFAVHINTTMHDLKAKVKRFAGELLERFRLSRQRYAYGDELNLKKNPVTRRVLGVDRGEI
ncbi:hypothetical protein KCM76_23025 [Zooshikella marina]|uniref:hypothetical protein n=1 Tax=Zooshikella ganghwensis TaxID=202772 RepID=UPI001BAE8F76|nr:hypothetical protein [Zooshikella ganghwensis]MBU2708886.1 hypothetical protein [Zooshikella ganghwensis]